MNFFAFSKTMTILLNLLENLKKHVLVDFKINQLDICRIGVLFNRIYSLNLHF